MRFFRPVFILWCAGVLVGPSAFAYYHFLRFPTRNAPFNAIPRRYDLNNLPNKTISYFVSEQGPTALAANDTLTGMISQIRLAAKVWNDVSTSDIRLQFGGILPAGTPNSAPTIEVNFSDEIPPGVNALTNFQINETISRADETFVPIQRSIILLDRNLTSRPSYSDGFFQTMVHELGHALGLQHSLTSGAMSTEVTRATTKSRPLNSDDIAGISMLYPARGFQASVGAITGRVAIGASGVGMASVVAIPATGSAVSTISNPDGSYRIDGVPPGQYFVYAHPLPPARTDEATPANIILPLGPDARAIPADASFETTFFPGTRDPQVTVTVGASATVENINFSVTRRNAPAISSVQAYGFIGQSAVRPPTINRTSGRGLVVATGTGIMTTPGTLANGLTIATLGPNAGTLSAAARPYSLATAFVQVDLAFNAATTDGTKHLLIAANNDLYVLPSAYQLTSKAPPSISTLAAVTDPGFGRVVAITGANLDRDTTFLFDGQPGVTRSFDEPSGRVLVTPPPAPSAHRATVIAVNLDGQSSYLTQASNIPTFTYDTGDPAFFAVNPSALPAGSEAMVEITTFGYNLYEGLSRLGFGSSDIVVRRLWVVGPNRILANVAIAANATPGQSAVTVANGLQFVSATGAFTVQPANTRLLGLAPAAPQTSTAIAAAPTPNTVALTVNNLPLGTTPGGLTLTVNDQPAVVAAILGNQIFFSIPAGTPPGAAIVRLRVGSDAAQPFVIQVDPPPPSIGGMQSNNAPVDATRPVSKGDTITLLVTGLVTDAFSGAVLKDSVGITAGGVDHAAVSIVASATVRGAFEVQFTLKDSVASGLVPITIAQDGRASANVNVLVR